MIPDKYIVIFTTILGIIGGTIVGPFIQNFINRKKSYQETRSIAIGGEISIGKEWENFGLQQKKDKEDLRKEFSEQIESLKLVHATEIKNLKESFEGRLTSITDEKNKRITVLEGQVVELQAEVSNYKGKGNQIVELAHEKLTEISDEINK